MAEQEKVRVEIYPLRGKTGYMTVGAADVPVYFSGERELILVDSGQRFLPELFEFLDEHHYTVRAVVQTHLHIDHVANNEELVSRYGTEIYACEDELEDAAFCNLKYTYPVITNRRDEDVIVDGIHFRTVFTPGHTNGHQLIITPDDVCCLGDVVMSLGRLETAKVPYMRDVTASILSMERLRETKYPLYLAAHRGVVQPEELDQTIEANIGIELRLYRLIRELVKEPVSIEELKITFMKAAGLTSPRVMAFRFMHTTSEVRIMELVKAGELRRDGDMILPAE